MTSGEPELDLATFVAVGDGLAEALVLIDRSGKIVACSGEFARQIAGPGGPSGSLDALADEPVETVAERVRSWFASDSPVPGALTFSDEVHVGRGAGLVGHGLALVRFHPRDVATADFRELNRAVDIQELLRTRERLETTAARLRETNRQLQASRDELDRFAAVIAHDLATPVAVVASAAELLAEEATLSDEARQFLDAVSDSTTRMSELIDGVLQLARTGQAPQPAEALRLDLVIGQVQAAMTQDLAGAELEVDAPVAALVSEVELVQLTQNLLGNAAKYRHPQRPLLVRIVGRERGGRVHLEVADNGLGIPIDEREHVFDLFVRGRQAETQLGTGLGLATCQRIVHRHGGRIEVVDGIDGGAAFRLDLPGRDG